MRTFEHDHRDNEKLHKLYVGWALEALQIANEALEELYERGNWNFTELAWALDNKKRELILRDAAFFEAAALIEAKAQEEIEELISSANSH